MRLLARVTDDLAAATSLAAFRRRHRFDPAHGAGQTYLPLRQVKLDSMATNNPETKMIYDYQFLPATAANLAKLTLTIPSGYTKTSS